MNKIELFNIVKHLLNFNKTKVVCDKSNNSNKDINDGKINVDIYIPYKNNINN